MTPLEPVVVRDYWTEADRDDDAAELAKRGYQVGAMSTERRTSRAGVVTLTIGLVVMFVGLGQQGRGLIIFALGLGLVVVSMTFRDTLHRVTYYSSNANPMVVATALNNAGVGQSRQGDSVARSGLKLLLAIWAVGYPVLSCSPLLITGSSTAGATAAGGLAALIVGSTLFVPWIIGLIVLGILVAIVR